MSSSSSILFQTARPLSRFTSTQARANLRFGAFRKRFQQQGRRWQSSTSEIPPPSWFKRMWDSPIGLKTVHFWAPVMKWSIVLAGISDFYRPPEKLSLTQNLALTATGLIWTRWCFVITPKNILLATVNFFMGLTGVVQISRIANYHYGKKDDKLPGITESEVTGATKTTQDKSEKVIKS
ncbi:hypothetical protein K3495_g6683 [Podosphaera aphanis]|nr:hypothetical protein K3495_g6683 [Podosphaera aphanis]